MIGNITLGTDDFKRAGDFYDALLAKIGAKRVMTDERMLDWGASNHEPFSKHDFIIFVQHCHSSYEPMMKRNSSWQISKKLDSREGDQFVQKTASDAFTILI